MVRRRSAATYKKAPRRVRDRGPPMARSSGRQREKGGGGAVTNVWWRGRVARGDWAHREEGGHRKPQAGREGLEGEGEGRIPLARLHHHAY